MKFCLKFSIILLIFLCLASPSFAWEQSFEAHPKDDIVSSYSGGTLTAFEHGWGYSGTQSSGTKYLINIPHPWAGYLGFSHCLTYSQGASGNYFYINVTNSNGAVCISQSFYSAAPTTWNDWQRIEFIESANKGGIDLYINGTLKYSFPYTTSPDGTGVIIIGFARESSALSATHQIDDISSTGAMIGCNPTCLKGYSMYYRLGYEPSPTLTWSATITAPNGSTLTQSVNLSEHTIPPSFLSAGGAGQYVIKLYQIDEAGHKYPMANRVFAYDQSNAYQVSTDKVDYYPGDEIKIITYAPIYTGYTVDIPYFDSTGTVTHYTYSLTSQEQTASFTLPTTIRGGSFIISLKDPYEGVKAGTQFNCLASGGLTSLTIDKATYAPLDVVRISYSNMPSNTVITIRVQNGNSQVTTNSWSGVVGSGVVTYTLPNSNADNFIVSAISGNTALGQTTGTIISGIYYLYGHIIDPSDNSLIPGATIQVGTASTVSDSNGAFNFTVPVGWQNLIITKTGYQSNINKVNIVYKSAKQDFYLVKSYSGSGHSIYGLVTNYYTGAPVTSAYITITQDSGSHSTFSYSGSGYYIFDSADLTGNWTVKVSKTGFYGYSSSVAVSGDTYKQIILTPLNYSSTGDTGTSADTEIAGTDSAQGSTGSSSSGSSSTIDTGGTSSTDASVIDSTGVSSDRPGREAAKSAMNELELSVPSLIGVVVIMAFLSLLGFK